MSAAQPAKSPTCFASQRHPTHTHNTTTTTIELSVGGRLRVSIVKNVSFSLFFLIGTESIYLCVCVYEWVYVKFTLRATAVRGVDPIPMQVGASMCV